MEKKGRSKISNIIYLTFSKILHIRSNKDLVFRCGLNRTLEVGGVMKSPNQPKLSHFREV